MNSFTYGPLQLARLLALASAHGHWWTAAFAPQRGFTLNGQLITDEEAFALPGDNAPWDYPGVETRDIPANDPARAEGWTPAQITAEADRLGSDMGGVMPPTPDAKGACSHTTATGRLSWSVAVDGTTRIVATRAHPKVQRLHAAWVAQLAAEGVDSYTASAECQEMERAWRAAREESLPPAKVLASILYPEGHMTFVAPAGIAAVSAGAAAAFVDAVRHTHDGAEKALPAWLCAFAEWYRTPHEGTPPPLPEAYTRALGTDPRAPITAPAPKVLVRREPVRQL